MHIVLKSTSDFVKVVMKTSRSPLQCQLNDSINWINPFLDLVGKKCGHLTLMMMKSKKWSCIVLHNFIGDWTTIYGQEKLHQCYWVHNTQNPLFLLFLTSGIHHPAPGAITTRRTFQTGTRVTSIKQNDLVDCCALYTSQEWWHNKARRIRQSAWI